MADSSRFDFCEKCGALSRDGQCQSCGYKDPNYVPPAPQMQSGVYSNGQAVTGAQMNRQTYQGQYSQTYNGQYNAQYNPQYQNPALAKHQNNNGGIIALLVVSVVILCLFLTCGVGFFVYALTTDITDKFIVSENTYVDDYDDYYGGYDDGSYDDSYDGSYGDSYGENTYPTQDVEGLESGKYYMELSNEIRRDLDYQVEMTSGYFAPEEYANVIVEIEYPIITGEVDNLDTINGLLEYEYTYYLDYFEEDYKPDMTPESYYMVYANCYVTYMDEKVMSVVFEEEVLLDDFAAINFYCLNFGMQSGVVLNNTEILNMDEAFAADFRVREILENGQEALPDYTDQQIMELLNDEDYLVIFYTPMGMEVGLNLGDNVIFMTYSDYEQFLNSY